MAEEQKLSIPFSVSDFFIYLIPGATFLVLILGFEYREHVMHGRAASLQLPLVAWMREIIRAVRRINDPVLTAGLLFVAAIMSYVVGHCVSSLSSLTIDRILIFKGHEYPHRYLLQPAVSMRVDNYSQIYYRGMFLWLNVALLGWFIVGSGAFNVATWPWWTAYVIADVATALVVVATVVKVSVDWGRSKEADKTIAHLPQYRRRAIRLFSWIYELAAGLYADFTHSHQPMSAEVRQAINTKFQAMFKTTPAEAKSESYWFSYMYVLRHAPDLYRKILDWLHLYQFARNLSTAFYMASVYCAIVLVANRTLQFPHSTRNDSIAVAIPVVLLGMACLLLARYYYLYVCYYSKFIFRSFAYLTCEPLEAKRTQPE